MSQGPSGRDSQVPPNALDELWYVLGDDARVLGPCDGRAVIAMIEAGSIGPASLVAKVGATAWGSLADTPAFALYLRDSGRAAVKYAGFWIRLGAYLIDFVILNILAGVAGAIIGVVLVLSGNIDADAGSGADPVTRALPAVVGLGLGLLYYIFFPSGAWQATPGKRICGIHIIRADGGRVTGLLGLGRYLAYIVSGLPLGLGFLMIGWNEEKKGLHDMMCGTRVVYGKL
jgi:uncharacterized RDD family membrane protein YckC